MVIPSSVKLHVEAEGREGRIGAGQMDGEGLSGKENDQGREATPSTNLLTLTRTLTTGPTRLWLTYMSVSGPTLGPKKGKTHCPNHPCPQCPAQRQAPSESSMSVTMNKRVDRWKGAFGKRVRK